MDFKSFKNQRQTATPSKDSQREDIRKTAEQYEGKSDTEMLNEIARAAGKEKREGTFSEEKLDKFASDLAPMLNSEQRERLAKAIRMIKGD